MHHTFVTELSTFGLRDHRTDRVAHVALWVGQIVLALVFFAAAAAVLALPVSQLAALAPWTAAVPEPLIRLIGAAELAGALGLILPALTGIKPGLTPVAALALAAVMALAIGFHLVRGETARVLLPLGLGVLSLAIAWGRLRISRIEPRPLPPV